jgi:WD40 repeat protein
MAASVKPSVVCAPPGPHGECFSAKFHHDMSMLAAGYADGSVLVYDPNAPPAGDGAAAAQGKLMYTIDPKSTLPTTTVRFRPQKAASKTRNVLVSCGANGVVQHWHITSGKCIHVIEEEDDEMVINKDGNTSTMRHYKNQIFTMEYNNDGSRFATAGKDYKVRLYDEATKSIISTLSRGIGKQTPGHSNRVFSVKFHPLDENMVLSAGWDNTVQIWDLRVEGAVRNIFGPHICGDSMDIDCDGGEILTGSWRPEEQLQLWDFGSGSLIQTLEWPVNSLTKEPCLVYAAQFSPDGRAIAAGGSGANEVRIYDRKTGAPTHKMDGLSSGVYSLDWAPTCDKLVAGLSDGSCNIIDLGTTDVGGAE